MLMNPPTVEVGLNDATAVEVGLAVEREGGVSAEHEAELVGIDLTGCQDVGWRLEHRFHELWGA